jgi:hypothetical protein
VNKRPGNGRTVANYAGERPSYVGCTGGKGRRYNRKNQRENSPRKPNVVLLLVREMSRAPETVSLALAQETARNQKDNEPRLVGSAAGANKRSAGKGAVTNPKSAMPRPQQSGYEARECGAGNLACRRLSGGSEARQYGARSGSCGATVRKCLVVAAQRNRYCLAPPVACPDFALPTMFCTS